MRSPSLTRSSSSFARSSIFFRGQPRRCSGKETFSRQESVGSKIEELENEADLVAPHARQIVVVEASPAAEPSISISPSTRPVQPADQIQQRRFARPRRPHDRHHLAALDREIDALERRHLALAAQIVWNAQRDESPITIMSHRMDRRTHTCASESMPAARSPTSSCSHDDGRLETFKLPSNPRAPAKVILAGLEQPRPRTRVEVVHGSTVATNALLERKGARTAFVTTAGFRRSDLEIGRQNRRGAVQPYARAAPALVPASCVSVWRSASVRRRRDPRALRRRAEATGRERLERARVRSVAICFLHAYQNAAHETGRREGARAPGVYLCASHEVSPEFREYERSSTTVVNAYVGPLMEAYLGELERASRQSASPSCSRTADFWRLAMPAATPCAPCSPVPREAWWARSKPRALSGFPRVLGFDMGGTSTDVSLCDGAPRETTEAVDRRLPHPRARCSISTPWARAADRIARVDAGGLLRVGPESAGADPGPACYGTGDRPPSPTRTWCSAASRPTSCWAARCSSTQQRAAARSTPSRARLRSDRVAAAAGILRVANANMERAIRVVSVERGHDPRDFALVAFGGCGGLHACEIAQELGIRNRDCAASMPARFPRWACCWPIVFATTPRACSNRPGIEREFRSARSAGAARNCAARR